MRGRVSCGPGREMREKEEGRKGCSDKKPSGCIPLRIDQGMNLRNTLGTHLYDRSVETASGRSSGAHLWSTDSA